MTYTDKNVQSDMDRWLSYYKTLNPVLTHTYLTVRDRMRTAVGQARLLMKERFKQFSGLVDDCELGRGEKVTTCTDLQGFWDMVYYQVSASRRPDVVF